MKTKMRKSFVPKQQFHSREEIPLFQKDRQGNAVILCPWCKPPHPINQETSAICGTILQVRAVQQIYHPRSENPNAVCVKCGSGKGEMVLFQGALAHIHDCTPGTVALSVPPKFSKIAKWVYFMKEGRIKSFIQNTYGMVRIVQEVMPDGKKTGVILGYFFYKIRGTNGNRTDRKGEPTPTLPDQSVS